jgi:hypothetical protein
MNLVDVYDLLLSLQTIDASIIDRFYQYNEFVNENHKVWHISPSFPILTHIIRLGIAKISMP